MNVAVIIPGFNEEKYIGSVVRKTKKIHDLVVYVDDGSSDASAKRAEENGALVISHEVNLGKGAAMKTGADYAFENLNADAVIFMDADDQHDPREITKFVQALHKSGAVFGVRNQGASMPLLRYMGNKLASVSLNLLFGGYVDDIPSGYKAFSRDAYSKIRWKSMGYEVETEIAVRVLGKKISHTSVDIDAIYHDTDKGMTLLDAIHICTCILQWRLGL